MIKDLIGPGVGFSPGGIKYLITRGLGIAAPVVAEPLVLGASYTEQYPLAASITTKRLLTASHPMSTITYLDYSEPWFVGEDRPLRFEMTTDSPSIAGWTIRVRVARWQPGAAPYDKAIPAGYPGGGTIIDVGLADVDGDDAFEVTIDGNDTLGLETPRLYWVEARRTDDGSNRVLAAVRWGLQGPVD